jgi:hypothetical protein
MNDEPKPPSETFAAALRAELDAVVGRYEALVRALAVVGSRETEALRAEAARLAAENQRVRMDLEERRSEVEALRAKVEGLTRDLDAARAREERLERDTRAAIDSKLAYDAEFTAERSFVEASAETAGSLLGEALVAAVGRALENTSATHAALKARGLEAALVAAVKDRGRSAVTAPLLERERATLAALAKIAGGELVVPAPGTRFSPGSMEKASTVSDPAEEGNVVSCAMPGLRRAGTDGALVFPKVVVATG